MWDFLGFTAQLGGDKMMGSVYGYKLPGQDEPAVKKTFPIYDDPGDIVIVEGRSYVMKPPVWEAKMDEWFAAQKELEKTFDSPEEYVKHLATELALTE